MFNPHKSFLFIMAIFFVMRSWAMVYDNRFFPLYLRNYSRTCQTPSSLMPDLFIMSGNEAFESENQNVGIPEVFGKYFENKVGEALVAIGKLNPIPAQLQDETLEWIMDGKIAAEGGSIQINQHICRYLSAGGSAFFMHVFSRINFFLSPLVIRELDLMEKNIDDLDKARRKMNDELGLKAPKSSVTGFSDIDLYVRIGNVWDYPLKFRRVGAGLRVGALIPTGFERDINNPASLPFGGNGHWGIYFAADADFELKEDWVFGFLVRVNKRFKKTKLERLPVVGEQPLYAALIGLAEIKPGATFIFSPYFCLKGLRDGLGLEAKYTLVVHDDDFWQDKRPNPVPPATLKNVIKTSDWNAEYITFNVFYDFAKVERLCQYKPAISAKWDIPVKLFAAKGAAKTNRLSLGIQFYY